MKNIENFKIQEKQHIFMKTFFISVFLLLTIHFLLVSNYLFSFKFVPQKVMFNETEIFNVEESKYLNPFTDALLPIKNYQVNRILNNKRKINTLLLGDSSLGYGIDISTFNQITKLESAKLALNGSAGFEGALGMLLEANRKHDIKNVILFFRTAQFIKHFEMRSFIVGVVKSQNDLGFILSSYPSIINKFIENMFSTEISLKSLNMLLTKVEEKIDVSFQGDYFPLFDEKFFKDKKIPKSNAIFKTWSKKSIDDDLFYTLEAIKNICIKNDINCIYSHGPMLDLDCANQEKINSDYLDYLNEKIISIGFLLHSESPVCLPKKYFTERLLPGLFVDIINEEHKVKTTKIYASDINKFIYQND